MSLFLLLTFSCLLLSVFTDIEINVNPIEIDIGFTKRLQVMCSLKREDNLPLATINSLAVFHSSKVTQPKYVYQASVNNLDGKVNGVMFNSSTASGVINNKGESFLQMTWEKPSKVRAGVYKCEATGVNVNGVSLTVSKTAVVRSTKSSLNKVPTNPQNTKKYIKQMEAKLKALQESFEVQASLQKILTKYVEQMEAKLQTLQQNFEVQASVQKNITVHVDQAESKLQELQQNSEIQSSFRKDMTKYVDQTDAKLQILQERTDIHDSFRKNMSEYVYQTDTKLYALQQKYEIQDSFRKNTLHLTLHSLFYVSVKFEGKRYYLIKKATIFTQAIAQEICKMYGGYLVEIDTHEEFNFLKRFLDDKNQFDYVMTGGSDEDQEGKWININSKTPLKVSNWFSTKLFGGKEYNCQSFWKGGKWKMNDMVCNTETLGYEASYMCEIPV